MASLGQTTDHHGVCPPMKKADPRNGLHKPAQEHGVGLAGWGGLGADGPGDPQELTAARGLGFCGRWGLGQTMAELGPTREHQGVCHPEEGGFPKMHAAQGSGWGGRVGFSALVGLSGEPLRRPV